jgi:Xaa-Pro aminopeptidase
MLFWRNCPINVIAMPKDSKRIKDVQQDWKRLTKTLRDSPSPSERKAPKISLFEALFVNVASNPFCDVSLLVKDLSGFTGSDGFLIACFDNENDTWGAIFVDSRYTIQARKECGKFSVIECNDANSRDIAIINWCKEHLPTNIVGFHVNLSMREFDWLRKLFPYVDFTSMQVSDKKLYEIELYDKKYCGRSRPEDYYLLAHISKNEALLLSSPDEIAWIYNLRSKQLNHCAPIFPCLGLATHDRTFLFIPQNSFDYTLNMFNHITYIQLPCDEFYSTLGKLVEKLNLSRLVLDDSQVPQILIDNLPPSISVRRVPSATPARRCIKNETEIDNVKRTSELDSAAIIKLLAWIDTCNDPITECDIATKLEKFRQESERYKGPSFPSIVAAGENAAIVHHQAADVVAEQCVLIDVGGQYYGGTTDVTRTIWISPSKSGSMKQLSGKSRKRPKGDNAELIDAYTRVLRGHIALAKATFSTGTTGANLDVLARQFLWDNHQDYQHGTGHGIGSYLSVHEGPCGISRLNMYPLKPRMVLSNEPGFYKEGEYGVRLENMMHVCEDTNGFLKFEMLSLIPFCSQLVDFSVLTDEETGWLKCYHAQVLTQIKPHLDKVAMHWLEVACRLFFDC